VQPYLHQQLLGNLTPQQSVALLKARRPRRRVCACAPAGAGRGARGRVGR